ncbi:MAG: formyltransferase family protein [Chitinophagaceae bacterium]
MKTAEPKNLKVLFLSKKDNEYAQRAAAFVKQHFSQLLIFEGGRKDKLPPEVLNWKGDLLISFISSWIYPKSLLENVRFAAINFHPGSPEYPGTGCTNFAIYNGEKEYGITCHHMDTGVDSGSIIRVVRFPVKEEDTVYKVTQHCYKLIEESFYELMNCILEQRPLPVTNEQWKRKPYTRKQLDELCTITPDMSETEIERRIKATTYKTPWAFTKIGDHIFKLQAANK